MTAARKRRPTFQTAKGTTRRVILAFNWAIKFPRLRAIARGMWGNRKERRVYAETRHPALAPIIWADRLGLVVIMRRADPMEADYFHSHVMELMRLIDRDDAPSFLPVEMTLSSFGWIDGQPVAIDYAEQVEEADTGTRNFQRR